MTIPQRSFAALLGLLLGAQAVGKLVDMHLYASALGRFHAVPETAVPVIAVVWVGVEILAFGGLGAAALRPRRALMLVGAAAALIDALAYAALTIGTSVRGIEVLNCTCFGAFLPQRLSASVLAQDVFMVVWTAWTLKIAVQHDTNRAPFTSARDSEHARS